VGNFFRTYESVVVGIGITMACDINLVCIVSTKTMRIMTIHLGIVWENTTPSTELPRDFCAGIAPLQLGVVLFCYFSDRKGKAKRSFTCQY